MTFVCYCSKTVRYDVVYLYIVIIRIMVGNHWFSCEWEEDGYPHPHTVPVYKIGNKITPNYAVDEFYSLG